MAEPYVQFVWNFSTKEPFGGPAFVPGSAVTPSVLYWQVTADAAGKIVIRDHAGIVIGSAKWHFNKTIERARDRDTKRVNDERWDALDSLLYTYIEAARAAGPADPNMLDPGVVAHPAGVEETPVKVNIPDAMLQQALHAPVKDEVPVKKQGLVAKIFFNVVGVIALVIILAVAGVGIYVYEKYVDKNLANGEKCTLDKECASGRCYSGACRADYDHDLGNGSRCVSNSECASGKCSSNGVCRR